MNIAFSFRPKLLDTLKSYTRQDFRADLIAGLTVGIVAIPLAMAFAIARVYRRRPESSLPSSPVS